MRNEFYVYAAESGFYPRESRSKHIEARIGNGQTSLRLATRGTVFYMHRTFIEEEGVEAFQLFDQKMNVDLFKLNSL